MSKRAEEAALKAYPVHIIEHQKVMGGVIKIDTNTNPRFFFTEGYEQAEKDLECADVLREEKQKCLAEIRKVKDPYAAALIGDKDFAVTHGEVGYWNQRGLSILLDKPCEKLGLKEGKRYKVILVEETEKRCHECRRYDEHGGFCVLDDLAPCKFVPKI